MYNNSISSKPTYFLRGVELIQEESKRVKIPSENWCYPRMAFGNTNDYYYAEIWTDGMDWTSNFWLIESENLNNPRAHILMMVDHHQNGKVSFNECDLNEFLRGVMWWRRNKLWIKHDNRSVYDDTIKPYLKITDVVYSEDWPFMYEATFAHASQPQVKFIVNKELLLGFGQISPRKD